MQKVYFLKSEISLSHKLWLEVSSTSLTRRKLSEAEHLSPFEIIQARGGPLKEPPYSFYQGFGHVKTSENYEWKRLVMSAAPGKYDDACAAARRATGAEAVILVVVKGDRGSGFSVQSLSDITPKLPGLLRSIAREIEQRLPKPSGRH